MAYTHYWSRPQTIPLEAYSEIRRDLEKLILPFSDTGVALAGWMGKGLPEIDDTVIRFNGVRDCGHPPVEDLAIRYPSEEAQGIGPSSTAPQGKPGRTSMSVKVKHRCCCGSCACETFLLERTKELRPHDSPSEAGLYSESVNTAFRPYDIAVTACLLIAKRHLNEDFRVYSSGADTQWSDARRLCQRVLGYGDWFGIVEEYLDEYWTGLDGTVGRRKTKLLTLIEIKPASFLAAAGARRFVNSRHRNYSNSSKRSAR